MPRLKPSYDVVVLGGGHAGLAAGLKAALLHHTAAIIDRGPKHSRSFYAPVLDNIPGFPDGISGHKLLDAQIAAVRKRDDRVGLFTPATAVSARRVDGEFEATFEWLKVTHVVRSKALVLALGMVDRMPEIGGAIDSIFPWANLGLVDFCLFCDGHTMPGKRVAVLGHDAYAVRNALDIRHFSPASVELLTLGRTLLEGSDDAERAALTAELARTGTPVIEGAITGYGGIQQRQFRVKFADGSVREYDKGFLALGWYDQHHSIPRSLGAQFDEEGSVITDEDCRALDASGAPLPGLYCIGDLRNGWDQIPEAWATAERAIIHAYGYYL